VLADALGDRQARREAGEEIDEQIRDLDEVLRRTREQLDQVVVPRNEAHASGEPTRFQRPSAPGRYP
jgi:hypothetical protein